MGDTAKSRQSISVNLIPDNAWSLIYENARHQLPILDAKKKAKNVEVEKILKEIEEIDQEIGELKMIIDRVSGINDNESKQPEYFFNNGKNLYTLPMSFKEAIRTIIDNPSNYGYDFVGTNEIIEVFLKSKEHGAKNVDDLGNTIRPTLSRMLGDKEFIKYRIKGSSRKIVPVSRKWLNDDGTLKAPYRNLLSRIEIAPSDGSDEE